MTYALLKTSFNLNIYNSHMYTFTHVLHIMLIIN